MARCNARAQGSGSLDDGGSVDDRRAVSSCKNGWIVLGSPAHINIFIFKHKEERTYHSSKQPTTSLDTSPPLQTHQPFQRVQRPKRKERTRGLTLTLCLLLVFSCTTRSRSTTHQRPRIRIQLLSRPYRHRRPSAFRTRPRYHRLGV